MQEKVRFMNKICYILNFYLGDRRWNVDRFQTDKLCYVKGQIETLQKYTHSLTKIIFSFNVEPEHYTLLSDAINIIPKTIQGAEIEINVRENYGMSYAAFSEMFVKHLDEFDYYIFNEDDYFYVQDNFDQYLLNKYNSLPNCGYLCGLIREEHGYGRIKSGGMSSGISSYSCLKKVYNEYGELPHSKGKDYRSTEIDGQVNQTNAIIKLGYEIYDTRDEYRTRFWQGNEIENYFFWNDIDLIIPSKILFGESYVWHDIISQEYLRMESDYNSTKYFEY